MTAEYLNIDTTPAPDTLSLPEGPTTQAISPGVAETRANKFNVAFGDVNIPEGWDYNDYFSVIASGQEIPLRKQIASVIDSEKFRYVKDKLSQALTMGPDEMHNIFQAAAKPTDPNSVMEDHYAAWYLDKLNWASPDTGADSWWYDAYRTIPNQVNQSEGLSKKALALREYAIKLDEEVDQQINTMKSTWVGTGNLAGEFLFSGFQPLREVVLRGNVPGVYKFRLGSNVKEQASRLYDDDFDVAKSKLDKITTYLKGNPYLAKEFLSNVIGVGTSEEKLNNMFTMMEVPTALSVIKLGTNVVRGAVLENQVKRAFKTAIKDMENTKDNPPQVVAPAAAGDLPSASTESLAKEIQDAADNKADPVHNAMRDLPTALRLDTEAGAADPGNYGQTMSNQVKADGAGFIARLQKVMDEVLKVERLPDFLKVKAAVAKTKELMGDLFKGFTVLNIDEPVWHSGTNTYHIPFNLGSDGKYFNTPNEAYNFGEAHGLTFANQPVLRAVNKQFSEEAQKLTKQINELSEEIRQGPDMHADVNEMNRHAVTLPAQLKALEAKFDDLLAWHGEKLQELGGLSFKDSLVKIGKGLGATVEEKSFLQDKFIKKYGKDYVGKLTPEELDMFTNGTIEQQGKGYYIRYVKPLDETQNLIRDAMLQTAEARSPRNIMKDFVGWIRSPEETQSFNERLNRKVASYSSNLIEKLLREEAQSIQAIYSGVIKKDYLTNEQIGFFKNRLTAITDRNFSRNYAKRWFDWERTVDLGRYLIDPDASIKEGRTVTGYWYKTPAEFERYFESVNGYFPEPVQVHAYMSFKRVYEADRMFRNMLLYRGASRVGAETHMLSVMGADGVPVKSAKFAGVWRNHLPGTTDNIFIMDKELGGGSIERGGTIAPKQLEKLRQEIEQGIRRVIEIYNPELRPLKGFDNVGSERIRYVITNSSHTVEPLSMDILPRRGGGHIVYDYDHYIKQAIVRPEKIRNTFRHWYEGDTTIAPVNNRAMGQKYAKHLDQVRIYLKNKDEANAQRYTTAHLPNSWEEVRKWFLGGRNMSGGIIEPRLNLDEPIQVVPRGRQISQMDNTMRKRYDYYDKDGTLKNSFEDGTKQGSLARQYQVDFTAERDADLVYAVDDVGSLGNPVWKYEPAKFKDVMPTLNSAIRNISKSMFMDDYKIFAVERWIREAAPHLNLKDPESELRSAPFYHFYSHEYLPGDYSAISHLAQQHYKIKSFIGEKGIAERTLDHLSDKFADSLYNSLGPGKITQILPKGIKNALWPFQALRSVAFHTAIGLFSVPQMIAQSMTYAAILGVSGASRAGPGTMAAFLHQSARLVPWAMKQGYKEADLIKVFDNIASHPKFNIPGMVHFKPGWFEEAYNALKTTGFDIVGHEHSMLERIYTPKPVSNGFANFLDAGAIIFKGSERNARFGSWYTAYLEFREKNPTGALSNKDVQSILERADMLSGNMSRASRSLLQTGILSYPAQFLGYQLRMAELFTGSRVADTGMKAALVRARIVMTNTALFGFPTAAGITGFPAGDLIRKYAIENGYVVGDNFLKDLAFNGIPAVAIAFITGGGDYAKGTTYNIGNRYGAPGFDQIRDALVSDKPYSTIMQGAAGSLFAGALQQTSDVRRFMWDVLTGSNDKYPLRPEDLINPIVNNVNSMTKAKQVFQAMNTGNWISKNEQLIQDKVSWQKALFMGITGLQDQNAQDAYTKSLSLGNRNAAEQETRKEFFVQYHRWLESLRDNDPEQTADYARRAQSVLERNAYPLAKRDALIAQASRGYETLINRMNDQFYMKNVPSKAPLWSQFADPNKSNQQILQDAYQRTLKLQRAK